MKTNMRIDHLSRPNVNLIGKLILWSGKTHQRVLLMLTMSSKIGLMIDSILNRQIEYYRIDHFRLINRPILERIFIQNSSVRNISYNNAT